MSAWGDLLSFSVSGGADTELYQNDTEGEREREIDRKRERDRERQRQRQTDRDRDLSVESNPEKDRR